MLGRELGRGASGFVYAARRPEDERNDFAIKVLHPVFEPGGRRRDREASIAPLLTHPNIVQTLQVGTSEGREFIVMERLRGLPLDRLLRRRIGRRRLRKKIASRIAIDVLAGLEFAHQLRNKKGRALRVVHRDVTPSNIFVCWDGRVKILDFGIAKFSDDSLDTESGIVQGKFAYIAPEQGAGATVDARSDLWSVAVTFWEMLAGRRLFVDGNDVTTLRALISGQIPELKVPGRIEGRMLSVIERALSVAPEDRYASASRFARAIAQACPPASKADLAALLRARLGNDKDRKPWTNPLVELEPIPAPNASPPQLRTYLFVAVCAVALLLLVAQRIVGQ